MTCSCLEICGRAGVISRRVYQLLHLHSGVWRSAVWYKSTNFLKDSVNKCPTKCDYIQSVIFLQTALHVSGDTFTHHQEHIQTVITTSGIGRTVFATVLCRGGVVTFLPTPRQRKVASTVWPVPDVVITVWMCSWWWVKVSPETCRAVCRNIINCISSHLVRQLLTLIHNARTHERKKQLLKETLVAILSDFWGCNPLKSKFLVT